MPAPHPSASHPSAPHPTVPRPQPLGVLGLPAGWLVLPDVPGRAPVVEALRDGRVPEDWPEGTDFYGAAARGDAPAALRLLADVDAPWARVDAFVLDPTGDGLTALRDEPGVDADPVLRTVVQAAAFSAGLVDQPPDLADADGEPLEGEVLALALLTRAAEALEHRGPAEAAEHLARASAAVRPVLPAAAAQLLGTLATLEDPRVRVVRYDEALALLPRGHVSQVRAELLLGRGVALQSLAGDRAELLLEAVRSYQQALVVFRRETHPEEFAEAQTNLALCHLATPMAQAGEHLRLAVAVQALRDALSVWDPEQHPQRWASVTLNLANALQYLPSAHQADNLVEAVELYEQLLAARDPASDPLGHARVLANQGNALAHLGVLDHAEEKLRRARDLFAGQGETDAAAAVDGTLAELAALATESPGGAA